MKFQNTTQRWIGMKLILGTLIATCTFTAAANAQPTFEGKFTLPYEVHWNHAVLPAGEYAIQVDSKGKPVLLLSTRGGKAAYTASPMIANTGKGAACLNVTIRGNERRVRSVNLPQIGATLIFDPLTKTERETFAKAGQMDAVPVVTAQK